MKGCILEANLEGYGENVKTFHCSRWNSPNASRQFSNKRLVFLKILNHSSMLWHLTPKCKFTNLPLVALKFIKFLLSFLEPRVSFSSNFASLFSVLRHNCSVLFHLKLDMLCTKWVHQSVHFLTFDCFHEN